MESKSLNKIARDLIRIGLKRECKSFANKIARFINAKRKTKDPHEFYLDLYEKVISFNKHIASRYDYVSNSLLDITLWGLFNHGILTTKDIVNYDIKVQKSLLKELKQNGKLELSP
ncbi:MAG: hypothetical protein FWC26_15095 [Fibromonadales bacterium]|nr:hypothetical protein [Fibromonadales bacterium]